MAKRKRQLEPFEFDEADIRRRATEKVFARGEEYFQEGAVVSLVRRGDALHAEVEGSDYEPYRVAVAFDVDEDLLEASCTCPYMEEWDGWCKHIVAVMLLYREAPGKVEEQPPLAELLADFNREQLAEVLTQLANRDGRVYEVVAEYAKVLRPRRH